MLDPNYDPVKGKAVANPCFPHIIPTCNMGRKVSSEQPWSRPKQGHVKLNVDGSFLQGEAGTGMVLRDHDGTIIFSACRQLLTCNDALESELLALQEGLLLALQWSNLPIVAECDSLEAVMMVKSRDGNRSKYAFLIDDIKRSLEERNSCITHIRRSQNNASHFMANFGRTQCRTVVWLGSGPVGVLHIVEQDCNS